MGFPRHPSFPGAPAWVPCSETPRFCSGQSVRGRHCLELLATVAQLGRSAFLSPSLWRPQPRALSKDIPGLSHEHWGAGGLEERRGHSPRETMERSCQCDHGGEGGAEGSRVNSHCPVLGLWPGTQACLDSCLARPSLCLGDAG